MHLYPHKTVAENIGFPLKVRGIAKEEQACVAIREAAAQVHMETLLQRYPTGIIRRPAAAGSFGPCYRPASDGVFNGRAAV